MYLSIIFLPILGSIVSGIIGRKVGITGAQLITTSSIIISTILSIIAFFEVAFCNSTVEIKVSSWIDSEIIDVSWGFIFDSLTVTILITVLIVSSLVHIYSIDYMSTDPHNQRYFSYLSIFTFFMLILVSADNYLVIFLGWEWIGISSYLLINFWFTRIQANKSAIKALVINRVGDIFLSIAFFSIFFVFGNMDYATIFSISPYINENIITIIGILLLIGAIAKSAQIGLNSWLPDSIEGPTPVSALIHAATLVTAGVFLILRSSPIIEYSSTSLVFITWVGAITAFIASSTGLLQNDIKRVIAYSTCSQIGYLFIACGLSQYNVALFHLVNHAFFKASLFLCAGAVLHATYDQQDLRKLGGLIGFIPFTYNCMLVASLSLIAIPFITGFYSKDLILELCYNQYHFSGQIAYFLGTITASITAFYSIRIISLTFLTYPNATKSVYNNTHDPSVIIIIPLIILTILSIFVGYIGRDIFVGISSDFLNDSLFIHPNHIYLVEAEFGIPLIIKIMPLFSTIIGSFLALYLYHIVFRYTISLTDSKIIKKYYKFFNGKYYIDIIYNYYIIFTSLKLGGIISKILDRGIIELIGPYGIEKSIIKVSYNLKKIDTGIITNYALYITIGIVILIFILFSSLILDITSNILLLFIILVFIPIN